MPEYAFLDHDGRFGAIWYDDGSDINVFLPHVDQEIQKSSLEFWRERYEYVGKPEEKLAFAPEIHAAALAASLVHSYINMSTIKPLVRPRGSYHPRVWRGIPPKHMLDEGYNGLPRDPTEDHIYLESTLAASSLLEELTGLFRTITPAPANDTAYGHRIRELLILACTEVEAAWRGIYTANCTSTKNSYSTKEYVRLKPLLKLDEWAVRLKDHPSYPPIAPFIGWSDTDGMTTKSLSWYADYNAIKHNRENEFQKASMGSLIKAMAAVHILQVAQWGPELFQRFHGNRYSAFETCKTPIYEPEEQYIVPSVGLHPKLKTPFFG